MSVSETNVNIDGAPQSTPVFLMEARESIDGEEQVISLGGGREARFLPAVVPEITYTSSGNISEITDNCGRTETRKNGNQNWDITVSSAYGLQNEMKQLMLMRLLDKTPFIITDLYEGNAHLSEIQIVQTTNQNVGVIKEQRDIQGDDAFEDLGEGTEVPIYDYQIQFKQPSEEEGI